MTPSSLTFSNFLITGKMAIIIAINWPLGDSKSRSAGLEANPLNVIDEYLNWSHNKSEGDRENDSGFYMMVICNQPFPIIMITYEEINNPRGILGGEISPEIRVN